MDLHAACRKIWMTPGLPLSFLSKYGKVHKQVVQHIQFFYLFLFSEIKYFCNGVAMGLLSARCEDYIKPLLIANSI